MTFPSTRTMLSLTCLGHALGGYSTSDGRNVVVMEPKTDGGKGRAWEVLNTEIDELERLEWITLDPPRPDDPPNTARVSVTDKGRYWLGRWARKHQRELVRMAAGERAVV